MTFVEMIATLTLMLILAAVILPVVKTTQKRQKEIELRRALREIRTAIDEHRALVASGQVGGFSVKLGSEGCPEDLETLVKGVEGTGGRKFKFLRRKPVDPMTGEEWGMRCYRDAPDSTSWCGDDVYDVYTKSEGHALDGTAYSEW
jgi:general secretion pathway protein G